jgi:hypothetical protein
MSVCGKNPGFWATLSIEIPEGVESEELRLSIARQLENFEKIFSPTAARVSVVIMSGGVLSRCERQEGGEVALVPQEPLIGMSEEMAESDGHNNFPRSVLGI